MKNHLEKNFSAPSKRLWRLKSRVLSLDETPVWMGILNVTPDSFSDGGTLGQRNEDGSFHVDSDAAVKRGLALIAAGAGILDVGGESTRPGSRPVEASEQITRTIPILQRLAAQIDVPISIDTTSAEVAEAALQVGAEIVNDVSGATFDSEMIDVVVRHKAGICLGHIRGIPKSMQDAPVYDDVVTETADFLRNRRDALIAAGLDATKIALDPGIGFGKTTDHNLAVLCQLDVFRRLGSPLVIGHSRKRFLNDLNLAARTSQTKTETLDEWTATISVWLARKGVDILRVHNVGVNRAALDADEKKNDLS